MGDMMRAIHDDNVRREGLTPLQRAREDLAGFTWRVKSAKQDLREAVKAERAHRALIAKLEKADR